MHRKPSLKPCAAFVLLFVLVAAEALAVMHSLDFDAHAGSDPCNVCIAVAGLGAAAPARAMPQEVARTDLPGEAARALTVPALRTERPSARAPPLVS